MPKTVSYLLSMYPEFHETFVAREVEGLLRTGADIEVFSLKKPPTEGDDLYPSHRKFLVTAGFILDRRVIEANLAELINHPADYFSAILSILKLYITRPIELLKCLAVFPKTVLFARRIRDRGGVLHAHWATIPAAMALVINKLSNIPVSLTAHAWDIFLSPIHDLKYKIHAVRGVVTCTQFNVAYLKDLCKPSDVDKIALNYHGLDFQKIDSAQKLKNEGDALRLVAVGRLVEQKGFIYLIRALKQLRELKVQLQIVGDGPLHDKLFAESNGLPNGSEVKFLGRLSHEDTLRLMANSDVMVAPSVVEKDGNRDGIPNVILEAMGCATPIIGSCVSGIPEVVIDNETGYLVPPEDPLAISTALEKLASDKYQCERMGRNARALVKEKFDMEHNIQEFVELLDRFHAAA
jgi:colanic acid/amylovoran biosynthesis glycosyltransferase